MHIIYVMCEGQGLIDSFGEEGMQFPLTNTLIKMRRCMLLKIKRSRAL